jgi:hypothetical protein
VLCENWIVVYFKRYFGVVLGGAGVFFTLFIALF